jgi:hypothetical protein
MKMIPYAQHELPWTFTQHSLGSATHLPTHCGPRALCEALGETDVKGFDAPARIWRLVGLSTDTAPAHRSAFVGRVAELESSRAYLRRRLRDEADKLSTCAVRRELERRASLRKCVVLQRQMASPLTVVWSWILG